MSSIRNSKLLVLMFTILLFSQTVLAGTTVFPPSSNWQLGATNGTNSGTLTDSVISVRARSTGSYRYYVTQASKNLNDISYISVDWKGAWISTTNAVLHFGIATTQGDTSFDAELTHSSTFSRTTEYLDVSSYSSGYIKFGIEFTGGFVDYADGWMYSVTMHNFSASETLNATSVGMETATLCGSLGEDSDTSCTCGFWIGNVSTDGTNFEQNVTCTGTYTNGETFSKGVTSLTVGEYYYVRSWSNNGYTFNASANETYLLTKPNKPQSLTVTGFDATEISLEWVNSSIGVGTNRTTVLVSSETNYPSTVASGTIEYNGTADHTTVTGLDEFTTYYFSAFTYINDSGSPSLWHFSNLYAYVVGDTSGMYYNVFVRYEENGTLIDLSDGSMVHSFEADRADGIELFSNNPDNATGNFTFYAEEIVAIAEFSYNNVCIRSAMPIGSNITFYISTAERGLDSGNLTAVEILFHDYSTLMSIENHPMAWVYKYNGTEKWIIHKAYLQADMYLRPWLIIDETYHVGASCDMFTIDDLREISIYSRALFEVSIFYSEVTTSQWYEVITIENGWYDTGTLYVDFNDSSHSGSDGVQSAVIYLYYAGNSTLIESVNSTIIGSPWSFLYTKTGLDHNDTYYVNIVVHYDNTALDDEWVQIIRLSFLSFSHTTISLDSLDEKLNNTIGLSPFYITEGGVEQVLAWSASIILFFAMVPLLMFGKEFAGLGISGCGVALFVLTSTAIKTASVESGLLAGFLVLFGILVLMVRWRNA